MKRILAWMLALMLLLAVPVLAETAAEEEASGITLEQLRYHFEHSTLPRFFYEDPQTMLDVMKERGIYVMWTALADENGVAHPYEEGDFTLRWYEVDGATVLGIEMPAPEASPQCFRCYMVFNAQSGAAGYYTVEYDNMLGETAFLCGWTQDMTHMNYGGAEIMDPAADDYEAKLEAEAGQVAGMLG